MWVKLLMLVHFCAAFPLKCPEPAQWALRAYGHCENPSKYFCLKNDLINGYSENCTRSDFQQPGRKAVLRGGIDAEICSFERYQPFPIKFYTNASTYCIFFKSFCNEEGQVIYDHGNRNTDASCRCDYRRGYEFLAKPKNPCFCKPSEEDCSCYSKTCSNTSLMLSPDYQCVYKMNPSLVTKCLPITEDEYSDRSKPDITEINPVENNVSFPVQWRKYASTVVAVYVFGKIMVLLILSKTKLIRWIWKYCCRVYFIDVPPCEISLNEGQPFELKYSTSFGSLKLYKDGKRLRNFCIEHVENADAGTYHAECFGLRSKNTLLKVLSLPEAIKRLPERDITRYTKLMQSSETEKRYFVRIMIVGKESVGKTSLLRKLLDESIEGVPSTDGVDIVVRRCKINIEDGIWEIDKNISDDKAARIQRAVLRRESLQTEVINETKSKKDTVSKELVLREDHKTFRKQYNAAHDLEVKAEHNKERNIDIDTFFSKPEPITLNIGKQNEKTTDKRDTSRKNMSTTTYNTESIDTTNNGTGGTVNDESVTKTDIRNTLKENKDKNSVSLLMPNNLISSAFSTTPNTPTNHYALCGLWDFAGQKEFYATHQAFLTKNAIYLVVADMESDISKPAIPSFYADFKEVGEYIEFWFDSIHCHATDFEQPDNAQINKYIDPPIFLVFTGKDKYKKADFGKEDLEKRQNLLQAQLRKILGHQSKYHHLRNIFWVSNINDHKKEFENLQKEISTAAREMKNWGQSLPLKWIMLEQSIEIYTNKSDNENGNNFIDLSTMVSLAKDPDIKIQDTEELFLFLRFQHEEGNIIFFEDISDFIILNPKWLVDAFRCLVSDKIDSQLQHRDDWTTFEQKGYISDELITELFKSKGACKFLEQQKNLLSVMEKFDILVKIDETNSYIVPSMMPAVSFNEVSERLGIENPESCKRTPWLCLKFSFLPPAFYNHFSVWFIRKFVTNKNNFDKQNLELFRGICIFDIDNSKCEKLLVTMSADTIALQLLSFSKGEKDFGSMCSNIRRDLIEETKVIKKRFMLNISYNLYFKCSTGHFSEKAMSYKDLKGCDEYFCEHHKHTHGSQETYFPWILNDDEIQDNSNTQQDELVSWNEIALFKQQLENKTIKEGLTVTFKCEAEKPYPVVWYKDGIEISPSSNIKIEALYSRVHLLTILQTTLESKGKYEIHMQGASSCAFLDVKESDKTTIVRDFNVVAAIDIGSTFSSYASSSTNMFATKPLKIQEDSDWCVDLLSKPSITPSCILMKTDGSVQLLGYEAKERCADLLLTGDYLYFDKFKEILNNNENISNELLITDVNGRKMKAIDVFSSFIHSLMKRITNSYPRDFADILWVLTVPTEWSNKAKTFMRNCAEQTGVRGDRLIIALETKAVSIYFQYLHEIEPKEIHELDRIYLVVDLGGCAVNITAHEITDNGDLLEHFTSTDHDIGGSEIDRNFLVLFKDLVGSRVMSSLVTDYKYLDSYFDILNELEMQKRELSCSEKINFHFRIPYDDLDELCREHYGMSLIEKIASSKYSEEIYLRSYRLVFPRSTLISLFQQVGNRISMRIRRVIDEFEDLQIKMILLVGGLSLCPVIVKIIKESFDSFRIIELPRRMPADLAVVKGSVLYGHRQDFTPSRITEYTFGRAVKPIFDRAKQETVNGIDLQSDIFEILVHKNTRMNINEPIQIEYKHIDPSQKQIEIAVYRTKKDQVKYIDDADCELFCEVFVPLPESARKQLCVVVEFIFGYTDFRVSAFEKETGFKYDVLGK